MTHPSWCTLQSITVTTMITGLKTTTSTTIRHAHNNTGSSILTGLTSTCQVRAAPVSSFHTFLFILVQSILRIMSRHKALLLACRVSSLQWSACWSCTTCWRAVPLSCGSPSTLSSSSSRPPAQTQRWLHLWCSCSRYCSCDESGCMHASHVRDTVSYPEVRFVQPRMVPVWQPVDQQ